MRRIASSPSVNDVNANAARISAGGIGCRRRRAPTMMPSVPSEPTKSWVRSGPTAARCEPPVVTSVPSASTTSRPDDDVLDLAVAGRELAGAAAREPAADGRQRDRLRPVPARDAVLGAQLVLEHVAERAGLHVDEHRGVVDARRCRSIAVRSSSTPPNTGTLAPHTPLRPAAAVTGTRGVVAQRAARPRPRRSSAGARSPTPARSTWSSSAQIIASGHQSRLASLISAASRRDVGAGRGELAR